MQSLPRRHSADGKESEDMVDGVKVAEWIDYIARLNSAKRKIDKRIDHLGGNSAEIVRRALYSHSITSS